MRHEKEGVVAWMKVETSVARNRKFVMAGPAPSWLWICGLAYAQEGLTDGFIPRETLLYLGVRNARQLAHNLVATGLWDEVNGGWQIHDYLAYNKPASDVQRIQRDRQVAGAAGGKASWNKRQANTDGVLQQPLKPLLNPDREIDRKTDRKKEEESAEPHGDSSPSVMTFQTVGAAKTWDLTRGRLDGWAQTYPHLAVGAECRKAWAWVEANPGRRKTARGMPAFLVNWLNRAVDHGRGPQGPAVVGAARVTEKTARTLAAAAEVLRDSER